MTFPVAFPLLLGLLLLSLAVLVLVVELRILGYAYQKIGVPARWMFALLLLTLLGSSLGSSRFGAWGLALLRAKPSRTHAETAQ